ncbi:MAG: hypothetical protein JNL57_13065 [Bacteroidetes bacterium]|nr:hypothetical protein [Bacteroidota bacterium]
MNNWKGYFRTPQLWLNILFNIYILFEYRNDPDGIRSVIMLFWWQSVCLGMSNFVQMLALKDFSPVEVNGEMKGPSWSLKISMALFFAIHFGGFHLVYGVFILVSKSIPGSMLGNAHNTFLTAMLLFAAMIAQLPYEISDNAKRKMDIMKMFFTPYLRIIPMHLVILGGAFLSHRFSVFYLFMLLKFLVDIITDLLYAYRKQHWHPAD